LVINRAFLLTHQIRLHFLGDFVVVEEKKKERKKKERKKERKTCTVRMKERIMERKKETTI
jgi:2-phospho-L-lactate transferase/gluconeogenesis factor (CofD/UPF0052 family)